MDLLNLGNLLCKYFFKHPQRPYKMNLAFTMIDGCSPYPMNQHQERGDVDRPLISSHLSRPNGRVRACQEHGATDSPLPLSLFPLPVGDHPPLVFHIQSNHTHSQNLSLVLHEQTGISLPYLLELIDFGCVYLSTQFKIDSREEYMIKKHIDVFRCREDVHISPGRYIRLYARPKRFPVTYTTNWNACVVSNESTHVVVSKPYGIASGPSVDNWKENTKYQVEKCLGLAENCLHLFSRLDICTSGLLLLTKGTQITGDFSRELSQGSKAMNKIYKVLTEGPLPLGRLDHAALNIKRMKNTKPGALVEYDSRILQLRNDRDGAKYVAMSLEVVNCARLDRGVNCHLNLYESTVRLITGRTHQIRLQTATIGLPVVGDTMYAPFRSFLLAADDLLLGKQVAEPQVGPCPSRIALQASHLRFTYKETVYEYRAPDPWWVYDSVLSALDSV